MSFEGYVVKVCENGHVETENAIDWWDDNTNPCSICNAKIKHIKVVDETNGLPYYVNFKLIQKTPLKIGVCSVCGSTVRTLEEPTYEFVTLDDYEKRENGEIFFNELPPVKIKVEKIFFIWQGKLFTTSEGMYIELCKLHKITEEILSERATCLGKIKRLV